VRVDPHLTWYAARASGLVAWALVTASILWGLALSTRIVRRKGVPAWLLDLHRYLGTLSLVFVAVHVLALYADNYAHFGARELFVPLASGWRPVAVAWGVVATYLLVAIEVTSWVMRRLPRKLWRAVHLSSSALFVTATVHGFTAGADASHVAVGWVVSTATLLVTFLVGFRVRGAQAPAATRPARVAPGAP
jgi:predicted ferric reductase